jgi:hypothetical protein
MPKSCFVIGPIGELRSSIRSHADDFIQYIVNPTLADLDFKADRADKMPDPGRITTQIIERLKDADLVIADLTAGNPNVYYELSLRHAVGKPVIHMARDGTAIPFDVFDSRTIFFTLECRRAEAAREELKKQITRVQEPDYKPSNPIIEAIGIIALRASEQPNERQLAELMLKVDHLSANVAALNSRPTNVFVNPWSPSGARDGGSGIPFSGHQNTMPISTTLPSGDQIGYVPLPDEMKK